MSEITSRVPAAGGHGLQDIARRLNAVPRAVALFKNEKGELPWGWNQNSEQEWAAANNEKYEKRDEISLCDGGKVTLWREKDVYHIFLSSEKGVLLFGVSVNGKDFKAHRHILRNIKAEARNPSGLEGPAEADVGNAPTILTQVNGREVGGEHLRVAERRENGNLRLADALTGDGHRRSLAIHRNAHAGLVASNMRFHDGDLRDVELYEHMTDLTKLVLALGTRLVAVEGQLAALTAAPIEESTHE